jgi:hypothetical protein
VSIPFLLLLQQPAKAWTTNINDCRHFPRFKGYIIGSPSSSVQGARMRSNRRTTSGNDAIRGEGHWRSGDYQRAPASLGSGNSRARRSSTPARPYICRRSVLSRLMWPSTGPLLHACVTAPSTALRSCCKRLNETLQCRPFLGKHRRDLAFGRAVDPRVGPVRVPAIEVRLPLLERLVDLHLNRRKRKRLVLKELLQIWCNKSVALKSWKLKNS